MKVILAISGGIDSMVMLDIFGRKWAKEITRQYEELRKNGCAIPSIIVATFDHGTRPSARDDVSFVYRVSQEKYNRLLCYTAEGNLGENAPEAAAREKRYEFLCELKREMAKPDAPIITDGKTYDESKLQRKNESVVVYTAHHLDDLVETVTINLLRGTGWRGLAPLDAPGIRRPFLEPKSLGSSKPWDKKDIMTYAAGHEITFRQDPTNNEDNYLRNRVREKLKDFDEKQTIYELWQKQKKLKADIDGVVAELLPEMGKAWQRSWFRNLDKNVALEILRAGTLRAGISATRPQLENFRRAILTYAPGKSFNLPADKLVRLSKDEFYLE